MKSTITLSLNEQELGALIGLMDAGVKALGLSAATAAAVLSQKIEEARKAPEATTDAAE